MDLENIKAPQYVCFESDSFQDGNASSSSESMMHNQSSDGLSTVEGDLHDEEFLPDTSGGEFIVQKRTTRSQSCRLKKKGGTIPKPFSFKTDQRLKNKNDLTVSKISEKDFASQLRHHKVSQVIPTRVTKVKAFNLTETNKRKVDDDYLPLAEQIKKFQQKTPDRYHSSSTKVFQPQEHWSPPKLRPRTPKLLAVKRHRPIDVMSREDKELEEIKGYEFHAQPVDPRVYKPVIIEKTEKKEATKTKNIQLKTAIRAKTWHTEEEPEQSYKFRARPVPKAILEGPTGLGVKPEVITTKPKSPSFISEQRLQKRKLLELERDAKVESPAKKQKVEKKKPKMPTPVKLKPTKLKPFSFDIVDKERFALKEKKIQEEIEKENKPFVFKAQLLPSPQVSGLPEVERKPPTQVIPFNFTLDKRSLKHNSSSFQEERVSFKANPATVLHKEPFIPEKSGKQKTEIKEFDLNTDRRASERLKLKETKEAEEKEKEQILLRRRALEEEKERREVLKLRQELVHKANPIRQFKPVEIKPSSKPLTQALSPQFETDKRLQSRK